MLKPKIHQSLLICLVAAFFGSSVVHAQTSVVTNQAGVNARIEVLGAPFTPPSLIGNSQSRLVFYRISGQDLLQGATGVFVNGQYYTSLVAGGYSQLCMTPGAVEIGVRQFRVGQNAKDKFDTITTIELPSSQTQFFAVAEVSGRPVMKPVPASQALQEMAGTRFQMHTISRVSRAQNCVAVASTVVAAVAQPDQFILSSDTLFAFGKSGLDGLTQSGRQSLDQLTTRIRKDYLKVDRVHVIGHADPLGSSVFNKRLSVERASTVSEYLRNIGQITAPISSEGRGDREVVVASCGHEPTNKSIACNQPNRRVVTEVTGQRR